jgi:hypothetical protein
MFATNVNQQIRLHLAYMVTTWAIPCGLCSSRVRLHHVLHEPTLLYELCIAGTTGMFEVTRMLLHVIEHCVLARLCDSACWADEQPLIVLNVR